MGSGMFYDAVCVARRHKNVYVDISLQGGHSFSVACEEVGASKLLFGSDSPYANPGTMKRIIDESPLSKDDKAAILGLNIARLLNMEVAVEGQA
jgi:predicted TIM-barrel fold metal-dependent hydrolase